MHSFLKTNTLAEIILLRDALFNPPTIRGGYVWYLRSIKSIANPEQHPVFRSRRTDQPSWWFKIRWLTLIAKAEVVQSNFHIWPMTHAIQLPATSRSFFGTATFTCRADEWRSRKLPTLVLQCGCGSREGPLPLMDKWSFNEWMDGDDGLYRLLAGKYQFVPG
jgi:hypothetical protein